MSQLTAITREVGSNIAKCELTFLGRAPLDTEKALAQHRSYTQKLQAVGVNVISLPALPSHPDGVFIEDTAVVLNEIAVISRLGAKSRQGEEQDVAEALKPFRPLVYLKEPATLDGGDVMRIDKTVYVGQSSRTNQAAIEQLQELLMPHGYTVIGVPTAKSLHLKTACTYLGNNMILVNSDWVNTRSFQGFTFIETHPDEPWGANALKINNTLLYPQGLPHTVERIVSAGFTVELLDISELQKAEAGLTCMSIIFNTQNSTSTVSKDKTG